MPDGLPILVLGDSNLPEFLAPFAWLEERKCLLRHETVDQAAETLATQSCAGQVIASGRPGRFSSSEIEDLHALAPMVPIVSLVGVWCDGETRSGKPWPGVPRIAWHSWRNAFEQLWGDSPQRRSLWLPRIATDLDRLIAQPQPAMQPTGHNVICIRSGDLLLAEVLVAVTAQHGWRAIHVQENQLSSRNLADVWIWDWSPHEDQTQQRAEFARLRAMHPHSHCIVLQDFPRPEATEMALSDGADVVLGKPFVLADLLAFLSARVSSQPKTTAAA